MAIKILINGAFGRMGQMATKAISENANFELVGQTGREYHLDKSIKDSGAQVVIDFTHPDSVYDNTKIIIDSGARPVIGTSGLSMTQIRELQEKCAALKHGGIIVPNFSLGAVLMMKHAKEIVKYMPNVEIVELHHDGKADSPSGTALHTADVLATSNPRLNQPPKASIENIPHARGANSRNVPIHAVRLPGFLAHQEVIFGGTGETLIIRHDSIDRICFMPGICLASERVMKLDRLVYGLEEVL